jgi:hypothetical protein
VVEMVGNWLYRYRYKMKWSGTVGKTIKTLYLHQTNGAWSRL